MDYKEKLKAIINSNKTPFVDIDTFLKYFPELKDEDEEIRKALVEMVHDTTGDSLWIDYNVHKEDALAWLEKQGEQKPVDTAKQEMSNEEYCSLCMDINCDGCPYVDKSKHKEQKPVEWSEEDETVRNDIIAKLAILKSRAVDGGAEKEICEMEINWLKSIRPQSQWKPSENELEVLRLAAEKDGTCLMGLYENLKKLKG